MAFSTGFGPGFGSGFARPGDAPPAGILLGGRLRAKPAADEVWYYFDWTEALQEFPDGVSVASVAYTLPSGVTNEGEFEAFGDAQSLIMLAGGVHAGLYPILAVATLSNAEQVELKGALRVFN